MEEDEARIKKRVREICEESMQEIEKDPYSPPNYMDHLPPGVEQQVALTQVHSKRYTDGLELRIVSKLATPDDGIEVLVSERDPELGWRDVACKRFPFGEHQDLKYIVETFKAYEMLHGNDRKYLDPDR